MSRAVKPTLAQKKLISKAGLVAKSWLVLIDTDTELRLVSKATGKSRTVKKNP